MDNKKVYDIVEKIEGHNPSSNGDVNSLYMYCLCIVKEIVKWEGSEKDVFGHGYVHEKVSKINRVMAGK